MDSVYSVAGLERMTIGSVAKRHTVSFDINRYLTYSGGKKNPDLPIKSTENLNMTCGHCKRLVTTPTDVVLCLYSQLYEIALRILYIRCCELNYIHF